MSKNDLFSKSLRYIKEPDYRVLVKAGKGLYDNMPDDKYLIKCFEARLGYPLNLTDPKTFNEKIQWLKIHDRKDEYITMADKYLVKKYVENIIGPGYIIPTLAAWDSPSEIDFNILPNQFVLKCNHNSGTGMYICKDKSKINERSVRTNLRKGIKEDYYLTGREWPYKHVRRKIIAEKYMVDESGTELKDYKVFCFNGRPMYIQVDFGRFAKHERNLYSTDWEYMGFASLYPTNAKHMIERPICLEKMLEISAILSKNIPFVRVDLYVIGKKIYFGELTFYHGSGYERFSPEEWDRKLGDLINISLVKEKA